MDYPNFPIPAAFNFLPVDIPHLFRPKKQNPSVFVWT